MQIILIHIPKTAGVSIGTSLNEQGVRLIRPGYETHAFAKNFILEEDYNLPILAVVRNPFDRLYSIFEFYQYRPREDDKLTEAFGRTDIDIDMTFEEFILSYEQRFKGKQIQFNSCFDFIEKDNRIIATDVLKFENISEEYNNFCEKYRFKNTLKKFNVNHKKIEADKSALYTEEMRSIVEKIF